MLNIPESIKTLYKTDGVHKRFRAHFPGGELPDITNSDIIRESLHFTESICSQNVFRFGLAEASVLEFETVGVGNMYGYTFEASIGIDTDSLTAAELAEITSGSWDGSLSSGVFWMSLGTFRVESCPRNHGAMTHRKVTAYSDIPGALRFANQYESFKLASHYPASAVSGYTVNLKKYVTAQLLAARAYVSGMVQRPYKGYSSPDGTTSRTFTSFVTLNGEEVGLISATARYNRYELTDGDIYSVRDMTRWDDRQTIAESIVTALGELDARYRAVPPIAVWRCTNQLVYYPGTASTIVSQEITDDIDYVYPGGFGVVPEYWAVTQIDINISTPQGSTSMIYGRPSQYQTGAIYVHEYTTSEAIDSATVTFQPTAQGTDSVGDYVSFSDAFTLPDIINGFYELSGRFLDLSKRTIMARVVGLDPTSPLEISPGDYDEVWWDEFDVSPLASVIVTYKSGADDITETVRLTGVVGESVYEMQDNAVLLAGINGDIATLLRGTFAENAANVGFTPIELTMQGWPWLEAGDALEITAEDGTLVNSYALRVEMQGLQHLQSYITADGGEIIAEV